MNTFFYKGKYTDRKWYLVDAEGKVLGRLASKIARILRGKHKVIYSPHIDVGDFIVVINADKIRLTGKKADKKIYYHHTGYPGGLKSVSFRKLIQEKPERVLENAVKGMLPKNPLGRRMFKKLKVYAGDKHPHIAQKPEVLNL
ncbi:50S ribosomal protein L13 [candidate division KSB1 bacterium]|nr:MAG: 50S ribosomal protein L13 [candidate division KSB1 bacterium]